MTAPNDLAQRISAQVEHCYQVAEQQLQRRFSRPTISFALRGQAAGTAHLQVNRLRFNPTLAQQNPQAFVDEVVPHEVAHLLAWQLYGRVKPHGVQWQQLMRSLFQLEPKTRHSFDVTAVQPRSFAYRCQCQSHQLTIRRHNKVLRGQAQYRCRRCQTPLQLVGNDPS
ncbi:SprT family zinc-dependent metalloprotease [uncultured Ferrimonas sp.]|uniref:SprT family zinc-dependent metalloprotease n=1 Tax=uncultured Ferrimonas sp. TaxID=432640 RepID=UPI0026297C94|nr:SprT family zinc-dependent metalloprotease [uncultured Ferrimonas sp.]